MMEAQKLVYDQLGYQPTHMIALEIGGGNGLQGLLQCFSFDPQYLFRLG